MILNESLFEEYNDNNEQLYREIASQVRKEIIDKYGEDFLYGKCIEASDRIVDLLSKEGINSKTIEGWVHYDCDEGCTDRDYDEHTWVETEDGYVIDVTATQFNAFMEEDYPDVIISKELPYRYSYDEPDAYEDSDLDDWSYKNLLEAKKRKKKKISQVNPGEAIFKSVKDMQKWVKKRQKGMGYFVHMDCGNMDYNNDMFNKMHGLGDTSSSSTTDGGTSDAAPSGGDVGGGMGMGESFEMNKNVVKLSPNLIQFMKEHRDLINEEDWDALFLDYAEDELSEEDQSQLVQALISIGCDRGYGVKMKIIPPKKELRDYLTTREINFIKSNQKLLNNQDWIQFVKELNDAFLYKENMYAIADFLKATLPEIDFTELEQLIGTLE